MRVGDDPDLVVVAGGFVWITSHGRRYADSGALRNAGDRTLTRVDPSTGNAELVGGGLAPCGLAPDPSGDVWVANCYPAGPAHTRPSSASTQARFSSRRRLVRGGDGYLRGLAYGGGSLWVADASGVDDYHGVTQVDPRTGGEHRSSSIATRAGWRGRGYGDLWMNDFDRGSVSRMHAGTGAMKTFPSGRQSSLSRSRRRRGLGRRLGAPRVVPPARGRIGQAASVPYPSGLPCRGVAANAGGIWATSADTMRCGASTRRRIRDPHPHAVLPVGCRRR